MVGAKPVAAHSRPNEVAPAEPVLLVIHRR